MSRAIYPNQSPWKIITLSAGWTIALLLAGTGFRVRELSALDGPLPMDPIECLEDCATNIVPNVWFCTVPGNGLQSQAEYCGCNQPATDAQAAGCQNLLDDCEHAQGRIHVLCPAPQATVNFADN